MKFQFESFSPFTSAHIIQMYLTYLEDEINLKGFKRVQRERHIDYPETFFDKLLKTMFQSIDLNK